MLFINTPLNKSILIGDKHRLILTEIGRHTCSFRLIGNNETFDFELRNGVAVTILPQVQLIPNINANTPGEASLGFKAPRKINIHGEWYGHNAAIEKQDFHLLTNAQLVEYMQYRPKTEIERVLLSRLASVGDATTTPRQGWR